MSMPDELALVVLEVPRRVGAAGADDQLAAVENGAQQAVGLGLRVGPRGREHAGRARSERGQAGGRSQAAQLEDVTTVGMRAHGD